MALPDTVKKVAVVVAKVDVPVTPSVPEMVAELKVVVAGMLVRLVALPYKEPPTLRLPPIT